MTRHSTTVLTYTENFIHSSVGKETACNAGDPGSIPGAGRSAGEGIGYPLQYFWASLMAQLGKNLPAVHETWVQSLNWEDPLEKGKLPTPVFWPGEFHGLYRLWGHKVDHDRATSTFTDSDSDSIQMQQNTHFSQVNMEYSPRSIISSVQFSCSVMSDSLSPHGL